MKTVCIATSAILLHADLKDEATNEAMAEAFNVTPPFRLENFSYSSDMLVNITFGHMSKTNFSGITVRLSKYRPIDQLLTLVE